MLATTSTSITLDRRLDVVPDDQPFAPPPHHPSMEAAHAQPSC